MLAGQAGRRIHFLRWDAALAAFETDALLERYPETDRVTHPVIRRAAGLWSRRAVAQWQAEFCAPEEILIGEVPISGNRFVELVQIHDDEAEPLLAGDRTRFLVPVPTTEVRHQLESKRQASAANPQHADESRDAPVPTMRRVWRETRSRAVELGLAAPDSNADADRYDPAIYSSFFQHLLQHRNWRILGVDTLYPSVGSAHDLDLETREVMASADEVADAITTVESGWTAEEIVRSAELWHHV